MVNLQCAGHLFDGARHPTQGLVAVRIVLAIDFRLDAQRFCLPHFQLERVVVKLKARACQFKLPRLDDAIELEASVLAQGQLPAIRHNFYVLGFAHPKASDALHFQPQIVEAEQGICRGAARVGIKGEYIVVDDPLARFDVSLRARFNLTISRGEVQVHVSRIGQPDEQHARLLLLQSEEVGVLF